MASDRPSEDVAELTDRQLEVYELGFGPDHSTDPDTKKCVVCKGDTERTYRTAAGDLCGECASRYYEENP